ALNRKNKTRISGSSSQDQLTVRSVASTITSMTPIVGTRDIASAKATEIGRMARGKCSARTKFMLFVIAVEPEVIVLAIAEKMKTPTVRKPTQLSTPSRIRGRRSPKTGRWPAARVRGLGTDHYCPGRLFRLLP